MTTKDFSIGYVKTIGEVKATSTLCSPTRKKPLVQFVHVTLSSNYNKNVGFHLGRKDAIELIKKLQKALK